MTRKGNFRFWPFREAQQVHLSVSFGEISDVSAGTLPDCMRLLTLLEKIGTSFPENHTLPLSGFFGAVHG